MQGERTFLSMKLAIGADHGGYILKKEVVEFLSKIKNVEVTDHGTSGPESVDYPDFGGKVAEAVSNGTADRGIRFPKVRAALCHDNFTARMSRLHNDANILVMGERVIGRGVALDIVKTWLETEFEGSRHIRRLEKIEQLIPRK